jgi:hypothetical protein
MEQRGQRSSVPILLPKADAEVKSEDSNNTRIHSTRNWIRKNQILPTRFNLAYDPLCPCNEGQQTSDHIIFDCNLHEAQRGHMIKKIVGSGGSWPLTKDELTTTYLQAFSIFVKSIDIQTLN